MVKNKIKFIISTGALALMLIASVASAVVYYPPSASLAPGDITSSHILDGAILNQDISNSSSFQFGGVSVGTSTPYAQLSVWASTTPTGIDIFNVVSNSSSTLFTVLDNGFVGIGTTSPVNALNIYGSDATEIVVDNDTNKAKFGFSAAGAVALSVGTLTNASMALITNNTTRVQVTNNGLVGIGTTSPGATLSVAGTGAFNSWLSADYFIATSTTATSTLAGNLKISDVGLEFPDGTIQTAAAVTKSQLGFATTTNDTITSGTASSTLLSYSVPGGTLGGNGVLSGKAHIEINIGVIGAGNDNFNIILLFGGSVVASFNSGAITTLGDGIYSGDIDFMLIESAVNTQEGSFHIVTERTTGALSNATELVTGSDEATAAVDSSVAQNLQIEARTADTDMSVAISNAFIEIIK